MIRADVRGNQLTKLTKEPRPVGTTLPIAVELACGLTGRKPSTRTYVIADDFWTGVIDLDERSIYGLMGDDLEQMLRFETETFSSLDPLSSRLGFVELATVPPDTRRFWGTAVRSETLSGIAQAVRARGGKLELLANPIGLSSPDRAGVPWVEFTPEMAGAFAAPAESGGFPRAYVTQRSKTSDRWFEALGTMFGGELPTSGWQMTPDDQPPAYTGSLESLSDETILHRWVQGLATRVANPAGFPHVAAPQASASNKTLFFVGATAAMITLLLSGSLVWSMNSRLSEMKAAIARAEEPTAEKKSLDKAIKELNKSFEILRLEVDEARAKSDNLRVLVDSGDRFAVLLESLAQYSDSNMVIDSVSPKPYGLLLSGRAIRNNAVTQSVQRLEQPLAAVGWSIRPPSVSGTNQTEAGGPWTFEIYLIDQRPLPSQTPTPDTTVASMLAPASRKASQKEKN
ncbi:MAG: hypothetical protein AAFN77_19255 [Planctomycetota bacterium]